MTAKEKTEIMERIATGTYNLFLDILAEYGDGTKQKRKELTEFIGEFFAETVKAHAEYFSNFR